MPLTVFQERVAKLLSENRAPDSYLAGGAALHIEPNSKRFSNDLDYFHDSAGRVAEAFAADRELLESKKYTLEILLSPPGYVLAIVKQGSEATKVEWAHDSAWRFLPTIKSDRAGYQLHPLDLATNKVLALAGRDEPRDFLDVMHIHDSILPLGALCWAAAGKDPGFTPLSLLELIRRRGKYRPEDFARLRLVEQPDLVELKRRWLAALDEAEAFIKSRPPSEIGCLYYSQAKHAFVGRDLAQDPSVVPHYGRPGGVLPRVMNP